MYSWRKFWTNCFKIIWCMYATAGNFSVILANFLPFLNNFQSRCQQYSMNSEGPFYFLWLFFRVSMTALKPYIITLLRNVPDCALRVFRSGVKGFLTSHCQRLSCLVSVFLSAKRKYAILKLWARWRGKELTEMSYWQYQWGGWYAVVQWGAICCGLMRWHMMWFNEVGYDVVQWGGICWISWGGTCFGLNEMVYAVV